MPYAPHSRVTLSGVFGPTTAPVEEWSWSFAISPVTSGDPVSYAAFAARVNGLYGTHMRPLFGGNVTLTRARVAAINELGLVPRTDDGAYLQGDSIITQTGSATQSGFVVLQHAVAVSLVTARAGATGKGRFFLPATKFAVGSNYVYSSADVDTTASSVQQFLNAVAADSAMVGGIEVASTKGYSSPVTSIRLGNVPDTMRSRRGRMVEAYLTKAITN